ncbi:HU family DNA-binding protein [Rickettsia endosymbiont of Cardiosporidium cionae]|uniref:HU family DNA-binding protein n=1 Tax=Rickettsia endosymbiont of Cardiosporidium cionae TaxID=2777155 RepID=UPI001894FCBE|nr:HU family DNA-binding protein [Rickettsia endosymbiont of Cardiosporidium cionae]KAF8818314.1 HU family DNA-binding protein [Rickettsia endosymbiont of Cardiosporidium cionae]
MNKTDLVRFITKKYAISSTEAKQALEMSIDSIESNLVAGSEVALVGFGTFSIKRRQEKAGVNPKTREKITIPAANYVSFKAGKNLKEAVNK